MRGFKIIPEISVLTTAVLLTAQSPLRAQTPHHLAVSPSPVCAPPAAKAPAGRLRIDGWFGPNLDDSLIIVVDDSVRWRGLYQLCSEAPASPTVAWLPSRADSIRNVLVIKGDTVRTTYHLGGRHPSALVIETLRER